jgi:hypothetical protein
MQRRLSLDLRKNEECESRPRPGGAGRLGAAIADDEGVDDEIGADQCERVDRSRTCRHRSLSLTRLSRRRRRRDSPSRGVFDRLGVHAADRGRPWSPWKTPGCWSACHRVTGSSRRGRRDGSPCRRSSSARWRKAYRRGARLRLTSHLMRPCSNSYRRGAMSTEGARLRTSDTMIPSKHGGEPRHRDIEAGSGRSRTRRALCVKRKAS